MYLFTLKSRFTFPPNLRAKVFKSTPWSLSKLNDANALRLSLPPESDKKADKKETTKEEKKTLKVENHNLAQQVSKQA